MVKEVYSGITGLSILSIDDELVIVDDELNIYDRVCVGDGRFNPIDILRAFIKATKLYYKDLPWKQFETLAYKSFATSDFVKETIRYAKEEN